MTPSFDQAVELESVFGPLSVVYVPYQKLPEIVDDFFGNTPERTIESHYVATMTDGNYKGWNAEASSRELAIKALMVKISERYGYELFGMHVANEQTAHIAEITERHAGVIADGKALWLSADGQKLERRQFVEGEIQVVFDLNAGVTRERCQGLCEKFGIKTLKLLDFRYFHPVNGVELDQKFLNEHCQDGGYVTTETKYVYFAASDTLQKWVEGYPVFEDAAGVICDDKDALADSLL